MNEAGLSCLILAPAPARKYSIQGTTVSRLSKDTVLTSFDPGIAGGARSSPTADQPAASRVLSCFCTPPAANISSDKPQYPEGRPIDLDGSVRSTWTTKRYQVAARSAKHPQSRIDLLPWRKSFTYAKPTPPTTTVTGASQLSIRAASQATHTLTKSNYPEIQQGTSSKVRLHYHRTIISFIGINTTNGDTLSGELPCMGSGYLRTTSNAAKVNHTGLDDAHASSQWPAGRNKHVRGRIASGTRPGDKRCSLTLQCELHVSQPVIRHRYGASRIIRLGLEITDLPFRWLADGPE